MNARPSARPSAMDTAFQFLDRGGSESRHLCRPYRRKPYLAARGRRDSEAIRRRHHRRMKAEHSAPLLEFPLRTVGLTYRVRRLSVSSRHLLGDPPLLLWRDRLQFADPLARLLAGGTLL